MVLLSKTAFKILSVTIQIKATEQHFPVVLFITLFKVVLLRKTDFKILKWTIQMKAFEQRFPVVLITALYKVVLLSKTEFKILSCDHSNESHWAALACGAVY